MAKQKPIWKKGRGKLGVLSPIIGSWAAETDSPMGKLQCTRVLEPVLGGNYIQLTAEWKTPKFTYREHAIIGIRDGVLSFWSFTSDGKNSQGVIADGTDVHPEAICFEAQMPAGLARMIYWPEPDGSFNWAVESKTKKGWNRFTKHHYKAVKK
jgi:hypothetical protein